MRVAILLFVCTGILGIPAAGSPAGAAGSPEIGLLLLAIDVQRDHLRISEGMRISNPGPPVTREVRIALPPGAVYATFHRGLPSPREIAGGVVDSVRFQTGITEVAYSYALPAARELALTRVFPFRARRIEVVVRGPGVAVAVRGGRALPALRLGDQELRRWELRDVPAGSPVAVTLRGLPVARTWIPLAVAGALAAILAAGLILALRRGLASDGKNLTD
ncbi:MAG TPA: hypothetical protein VGR24_04390 [bacterium]|nr:hypothetical protein [bacterium]